MAAHNSSTSDSRSKQLELEFGPGRLNEAHGSSRTRTYRIWVAMKQRCHNPNHTAYADYGGRGITMCDRWKESFKAFLADMGECPDGHEIDREDNGRGYCKENCRWARRSQQMRNTRRTRLLTLDGRTHVMEDWAKELGIRANTLMWRIEHWGVERALSTVGPMARTDMHRGSRFLTYNGDTKSLSEWGRALGVSKQLLRLRIKKWGFEKAVQIISGESEQINKGSH